MKKFKFTLTAEMTCEHTIVAETKEQAEEILDQIIEDRFDELHWDSHREINTEKIAVSEITPTPVKASRERGMNFSETIK